MDDDVFELGLTLVAGKNPNEAASAKPAFKGKYDVLQISGEANIYLACERRRVTRAGAEDGVTLAVCVGSRGSNCRDPASSRKLSRNKHFR